MADAVDTVNVQFRKPSVEDGTSIWELVKNTGVLDLNSVYSYLMMCKYFPDTCVVAENEGKIVGFVTAFLTPNNPDVIFVWQIGVADSQRGKGLAANILKALLQREACSGVRFLETTITPVNAPSRSLFLKLAQNLNTACEVTGCFSEDLFPGGKHESEMMYRIGPF